jgi:hypothetical protein
VRLDGGVAGRGHDPLVGGEQVVGVGVEVRDAADQGRAGDEVVAVGQQPRHQLHIAGVALDEVVVRVAVVGLDDRPVLGVVVDADHDVATAKQLFDDVTADEAS